MHVWKAVIFQLTSFDCSSRSQQCAALCSSLYSSLVQPHQKNRRFLSLSNTTPQLVCSPQRLYSAALAAQTKRKENSIALMRSGVAPCPTEICGALVCFRVRRYALSRRAKGKVPRLKSVCMNYLHAHTTCKLACKEGVVIDITWQQIRNRGGKKAIACAWSWVGPATRCAREKLSRSYSRSTF